MRLFYTRDYVAELHSGLSLFPFCQGWEHGYGIFQVVLILVARKSVCKLLIWWRVGSVHVC